MNHRCDHHHHHNSNNNGDTNVHDDLERNSHSRRGTTTITNAGNKSETTKGISRLTQKLSKHKKASNEFPADEITEGASTMDVSVVTDRMGHSNMDSENEYDAHLDHAIIRTSTQHKNYSMQSDTSNNIYDKNHYHRVDQEENRTSENGNIYDEMRNDDIDQSMEENIVLLDISASRTSISTGSNSHSHSNSNSDNSSSCSSSRSSSSDNQNQQIDSNRVIARATNKNHSCHISTGNSSLPTHHSFGTNTTITTTVSPSSHQPHCQRPLLPHTNTTAATTNTTGKNTGSRYNHYDWSYTEETSSTAQPRRHSHVPRRDTLSDNSKYGSAIPDCHDDSTLETTAISNTSMDVANSSATTLDTSFETITDIRPVVITPTQPDTTVLSSKNKIKKKVTINESQIKGRNRSNSTPSSLRSPLEHDTLVIVEDDAKALEFRHTSLILQYASVELANYFVEYYNNHHETSDEDELDHDTVRATREGDDSTIQYTLHVQVQDANDWRSLQPFLEPHAVQPAVVTPYNLPVLLPWFQQLKLNVLLQECDMQLLYHLVTPPSSSSALDQFRTTRNEGHHNECDVEHDDYVTVWNTIRLGEIAVKAGLERTSQQAFIVAATWLKRFPHVWLHPQPQSHQSTTDLLVRALNLMVQCLLDSNANDSVDESQDLDISFESTDSTTWESMFQPPEASYLFSAMISFLPIDCVDEQGVHNLKNIRQLITNPLCPYLIREGIQKKEANDQMAPDYVTNEENYHNGDKKMFNELHLIPVASSDENVEMIADNETIITENLSLTKEQRHQQFNDNRSNSKNTNSSLSQVAEELHAGWNSLWMKLAVATTGPSANVDHQTQERESSSNSIYHVLSQTLSDQQSEMLLLQSPKELSEWLHIVWDKLCHPPIFGTSTRQHKNKNRKKDVKKRGFELTPARTIQPSVVYNNKKPVGGSTSQNEVLVSALRCNTTCNSSKSNITNLTTNNTHTDHTTTTNDDATNVSSRRTFAC